MSVVVAPSDNTGWGHACCFRGRNGRIGCAGMRATGSKFTLKQPVRVRGYYRAQWGQHKGRKTKEQIYEGYKKYRKLNKRRKKRAKSRTNKKLIATVRSELDNKKKRAARYAEAIDKIRNKKFERQAAEAVAAMAEAADNLSEAASEAADNLSTYSG
uniref:PVII n=1 Tax=Zoothera dauma adenovirus TaxID=3073259 RepID=A0AA51RM10_9ADEN|nr:pVII [Zoothera dauma adenovirus]